MQVIQALFIGLALILSTEVMADHSGRKVIETNGPIVKRILIMSLDEAPGKRWPPVAREISKALETRPSSLDYWTKLGEELASQDREAMTLRLEKELGALPYTEDTADEWIGPIELASRGFKGDCEDYAALALYVLGVAGVPEFEAVGVLGYDHLERPHAVVFIKDGDTWRVADFASPGGLESIDAGFKPIGGGTTGHVAINLTKE
ncbi:MAG: hypothetical protein P8X75_07760 [Limibacillus sp.]|jgi:hypothetical protein